MNVIMLNQNNYSLLRGLVHQNAQNENITHSSGALLHHTLLFLDERDLAQLSRTSQIFFSHVQLTKVLPNRPTQHLNGLIRFLQQIDSEAVNQNERDFAQLAYHHLLTFHIRPLHPDYNQEDANAVGQIPLVVRQRLCQNVYNGIQEDFIAIRNARRSLDPVARGAQPAFQFFNDRGAIAPSIFKILKDFSWELDLSLVSIFIQFQEVRNIWMQEVQNELPKLRNDTNFQNDPLGTYNCLVFGDNYRVTVLGRPSSLQVLKLANGRAARAIRTWLNTQPDAFFDQIVEISCQHHRLSYHAPLISNEVIGYMKKMRNLRKLDLSTTGGNQLTVLPEQISELPVTEICLLGNNLRARGIPEAILNMPHTRIVAEPGLLISRPRRFVASVIDLLHRDVIPFIQRNMKKMAFAVSVISICMMTSFTAIAMIRNFNVQPDIYFDGLIFALQAVILLDGIKRFISALIRHIPQIIQTGLRTLRNLINIIESAIANLRASINATIRILNANQQAILDHIHTEFLQILHQIRTLINTRFYLYA